MASFSCRASLRALAASFLLLAAVVATVPSRAQEPPVRIGSNVVTGLYFPSAGAICRLIVARAEKAESRPRCLVESTSGSVSNLRALQRGDLEFAVVQSDWLHYAATGQRLFKDGGPLANVQAAASLYAEALVVLVRADSKAQTFDDLRGQKIAAGPQGGGARSLFELASTAAGWKNGELSFAGDDVGPDPLCAGKADAAAALGAAPWPQARTFARNCAVRAVPLTGELAARAAVDRPWLAPTKVPAGAWPGLTADLDTVGLRVVLATRADLDGERVHAAVKAIAGAGDELAQQIAALSETRLPEMATAGIGAPMHPGAAKFYREAGLRERLPEGSAPVAPPAASAGPAPAAPPAPIEPARAPAPPPSAPPSVAPKAPTTTPNRTSPSKAAPSDPQRN